MQTKNLINLYFLHCYYGLDFLTALLETSVKNNIIIEDWNKV